jgi:hypothetical protein
VTDPYGDPFKTESKHLVVSNGRLHGAIMARLHEQSEPAGSTDGAGQGTPAQGRRARLRLYLPGGDGAQERSLILALPLLAGTTRRRR